MLTLQMATVPSGRTSNSEDDAGSFAAEAAALRSVVRAAIACILGLGRDHADVEDCTHETLRRAFEGRERLRSGEPVRPWLLGIARHTALDQLRARKRALARAAPESTDPAQQRDAIDRIPDPAVPVDEQLDQADRKARVRAVIASLADGPRQALTLFHVEGLGYQEVAQRLGVPMGTVATWIARGRRSIADALQEDSRLP